MLTISAADQKMEFSRVDLENEEETEVQAKNGELESFSI